METWQKDEDELWDAAEGHDPDVEVQVPEVVLEVERVLEVEDVEVPGVGFVIQFWS
jgi:hypothetical protein